MSDAIFELDTLIFEFIAEFELLIIEFELLRMALFEELAAGDPQPANVTAEAATAKNITNFVYITCLPKIELIKNRSSARSVKLRLIVKAK